MLQGKHIRRSPFPWGGRQGDQHRGEGSQPQHSHCCSRGWEDGTLAHEGDLGTGTAPGRADLGDTRAFSREPRAFVNRSSNKHLSFHRWCSQFTAGTFKGHLGHHRCSRPQMGHKKRPRPAGLNICTPRSLPLKSTGVISTGISLGLSSRNEEHQNDPTPFPAASQFGRAQAPSSAADGLGAARREPLLNSSPAQQPCSTAKNYRKL